MKRDHPFFPAIIKNAEQFYSDERKRIQYEYNRSEADRLGVVVKLNRAQRRKQKRSSR